MMFLHVARQLLILIIVTQLLGAAFTPLGAQANQPKAQARDSTVQQESTRADTGRVTVAKSVPSPGEASATGGPVRRLSQDTLVVRLEKSEGRDWTPVVIALVSVTSTVLVSVLVTWITVRQKNRELEQTLSLKQKELDQSLALKQQELDRTLGMRLREQDRAELTRRLTTFLGPLKQQLDLAFVLYRRLCQGDPDRRTREGFRTLVALLAEEPFSGNDRAILDELVTTTSAIRELIMGAEGYVENEELLRVLSMAAAHFRLLGLAATGKIKGEVARFESSTYPRELDVLVDTEIARVRAMLDATAHT
jgi:hypothetical protein